MSDASRHTVAPASAAQDAHRTRKKKKKKSPAPFIVLSVLFFAVCGVFSALSVKNLLRKPQAESPLIDVLEDAASSAVLPAAPDLLGALEVRTGEVTYLPDMLEKFKPLYAFNSDTIGWLRVPNTSIDTVVVQSDTDNGYSNNYKYLKNDFYGKYTRYGNLFLDYRCAKYSLSKNTIIYGHTTVGKEQVFYDLVRYEDMEFFKENPIIEYSTLYNNYRWKVFAVFATSINASDDGGYVFNYIFPHMSPASFEGYLGQVYERALYKTGVDVTADDKVLALSTCSYNFDVGGAEITSRLVVVARLLREGESAEIDASRVTDNPDYRRPQRWYDLKGKTNPYKNSVKWTPSAN